MITIGEAAIVVLIILHYFHDVHLLVQVFSVPVEEQRLKEMSEQQFGERGRVQNKICSDIMARTGTEN